MGLLLAILTVALMFEHRVLSVVSAFVASLYWLGIFAAPVFPGTAFVDPELAAGAPNVGRIPFQLAIGFVLLAILLIVVPVGLLWS